MTTRNETLRKLREDEPVVGAWLLSMSPRAAEVMTATDLDWIGIDTEHTPVTGETVEGAVRGIEHHDTTPIARLPSAEATIAGEAKHALDSGAQGVLIPGVETVETAERAVRAAYFPPDGNRGVAGTTRANRYGLAFDDYVATANDETLVVMQIETTQAVERVEDILAVDGIDVAFIGENDLSSAYGHPGEKDHPDVTGAVDRVYEAALANDVIPGIGGRTPERMADRIDRGFRFFLLGADVKFMRDGIAAFLDG